MVDFLYLNWRLRSLFSQYGHNIWGLADTVRELAPAERSRSRAAVFPDGDLDKIKQLAPLRNMEREMKFISGDELLHAPTRAFELSDVQVAGPFLYRGAARARLGSPIARGHRWAPEEVFDLEDGHLVCTRVGSDFFGHFLWDNLPIELLPRSDQACFTVHANPRWHEDGYRSILKMPPPPVMGSGRVKKLTLYADYGQNAFRAKRYRALRQKMRDGLSGVSKPPPSAGVYVTRGKTGEPRQILNEAELIAFLDKRGFVTINPDTASAEDIARLTLDTKIVFGIDGSHIAHTLYTVAEGGTFVILQPPDRFSMVYKEFTDRLDLNYAFIVGDSRANGFHIDLDNLGRVLDKFL